MYFAQPWLQVSMVDRIITLIFPLQANKLGIYIILLQYYYLKCNVI